MYHPLQKCPFICSALRVWWPVPPLIHFRPQVAPQNFYLLKLPMYWMPKPPCDLIFKVLQVSLPSNVPNFWRRLSILTEPFYTPCVTKVSLCCPRKIHYSQLVTCSFKDGFYMSLRGWTPNTQPSPVILLRTQDCRGAIALWDILPSARPLTYFSLSPHPRILSRQWDEPAKQWGSKGEIHGQSFRFKGHMNIWAHNL